MIYDVCLRAFVLRSRQRRLYINWLDGVNSDANISLGGGREEGVGPAEVLSLNLEALDSP